MKKLLLFGCAMLFVLLCRAQQTFPVNGAWDIRPGQYAFTNASIVVNADQTITNGILLVKDRQIEAVLNAGAPPERHRRGRAHLQTGDGLRNRAHLEVAVVGDEVAAVRAVADR